MNERAEEPTIATQVMLETMEGDVKHSHRASIADLSSKELWVEIAKPVAVPFEPGRQVRIVLSHPKRPTQTADTIVLWRLGQNGNVVALKRPTLWDPPSRREHARVQLALPVYVRIHDNTEMVPTISANISVGGVFCVLPLDVMVTQQVGLSIQLTPHQLFECSAEVARIDRDADDPTGVNRHVGFRFLGLAWEDQAALAASLTELAGDVDVNYIPRPWRPDAFIAPDTAARRDLAESA